MKAQEPFKYITSQRLVNQQIHASTCGKASDLLKWMGAIQSQDFTMTKWALGLRAEKENLQSIDKAFDRGELLRSHLLRPTWHMVAAQNIHWLLGLSAPKIKSILKNRHKEMGLYPEVLQKSNATIEKALTPVPYLSREELVAQLEKEKLPTQDNRPSHYLLNAELEGIITSGPIKKGKPTYALLDKRVKRSIHLERDEAFGQLAQIYFSSRGPATLQDFSWWSGLGMREARTGLELATPKLSWDKHASTTYYGPLNSPQANLPSQSVFILPAFDEYLIAYRDRKEILSKVSQKHAISQNGMFRPVIVLDGNIVGIWKRTTKKDLMLIETQLIKNFPSDILHEIEIQLVDFASFFNKNAQIQHGHLPG